MKRKKLKDFIGYLRLVAARSDRMAFWRVVNTPARGLGIKSLEKLDEYCKKHEVTPFKAVRIETENYPPSKTSLDKFCMDIDSIHEI